MNVYLEGKFGYDRFRMKNLYWNLQSSERFCRVYQWARLSIPEDFSCQQHRCENLKPPKTFSHLTLSLRNSKPIMKKPVVFQFLALGFKNAGPLNEGLLLEVQDHCLSLIVVVLSYSVAVSNAFFFRWLICHSYCKVKTFCMWRKMDLSELYKSTGL